MDFGSRVSGFISAGGGGAGGGMEIGEAITGATDGSVLFVGTGSTLEQDNANFFWDNPNNRLGIGTTTPESKLTIRTNALGSTADSSAGLILVNETAAALGLPQYSPFLTFEGRAWNTVSGNSRIRFRVGVVPLQSNPTSGTLVFQSAINDAAFANVMTINQGGTLALSNALTVAGTSTFSQDVTVNANTNTFRLNATNEITNTASVANNTSRNVFQSTAVINTTGGTQTIRGFYYNPTLTSLTGTTNIGFQNTSGNNLFNSTSGNTLIGTTTDAGFKLDVTGTARISTSLTVGSNTLIGLFSATLPPTTINFGALNTNSITTTTSVDGIVTSFSGTTGVSTPVRISPVIRQRGYAWNGVAPQTADFWTEVIPVSGTNPITAAWNLKSQIDAGGGIQRMIVRNNGDLLVGTISGSVGIGVNTSIAASAILDVTSTTKGFLQPRMTTVERDAIVSPATGLQVYNTTTNTNDFYNGGGWVSIAPLPSLTSGSVLFSNGTTIAQDNTNFFWDDTNNRLGIGTATPESKLTIVENTLNTVVDGFFGRNGSLSDAVNTVQNSPAIRLRASAWNSSTGNQNLDFRTFVNPTPVFAPISGNYIIQSQSNGAGYNDVFLINTSGSVFLKNGLSNNGFTSIPLSLNSVSASSTVINLGKSSFGHTNNLRFTSNDASQAFSLGQGRVGNEGSTDFIFARFQNPTWTEVYRIPTGTGNFLLGTTTDSGFKLDVNGAARVVGANTSGTAFAFTTQNSAGENLLRVTNNGILVLGNGTFERPLLFAGLGSVDNTSSSLTLLAGGAGGGGYVFNRLNNFSNLAGFSTHNHILSNIDWTQTNRDATLNHLNLTGSLNNALGKMRGIFVNYTVTTGDFKAFQSTVGGGYFNTSTPASSAILQADATTQGFLPPRMTTAQKTAIASPVAGLQVYDTTLNQMSYYNGTAWINF